MKLLNDVKKYWSEKICLPRGSRVLVACSGGIDSLALLDVLYRLQDEFGIDVAAAHFEHGIRGKVSLEDAEFVRAFCAERGVEFYMDAADVPAEAMKSGESLETVARRLRYAFLRRVAGGLGSERVFIATAHHRDDQAETVLMHILRGTGIKGLCGIQPRQGDLIRPLLFAPKSILTDYCMEQNLQPRHDATNDEADCTRNKLRLELLPALRVNYNPDITTALCQLADVARADEAYLDSVAEKAWQKIVQQNEQGVYFASQKFAGLDLAVQRRLVQKIVQKLTGKSLSFVHIQSVLELIKNGITGKSIELPFSLLAKISYEYIYIIKNTIPFSENNGKINNVEKFTEFVLPVPGELILPDGTRLTADLLDVSKGESIDRLGLQGDCIYGDLDKCPQGLRLRHRRNGDKVNLGHGHKKLKDFLIDCRVPREERERLWLLVTGTEQEEKILWIPSVRRFADALTDNTTKNIFYVQIRRLGNVK